VGNVLLSDEELEALARRIVHDPCPESEVGLCVTCTWGEIRAVAAAQHAKTIAALADGVDVEALAQQAENAIKRGAFRWREPIADAIRQAVAAAVAQRDARCEAAHAELARRDREIQLLRSITIRMKGPGGTVGLGEIVDELRAAGWTPIPAVKETKP
jgi:hypothetical protein